MRRDERDEIESGENEGERTKKEQKDELWRGRKKVREQNRMHEHLIR